MKAKTKRPSVKHPTTICPKCLGLGIVKVLMTRPFDMGQPNIMKKQSCSLCDTKGRVRPAKAAEYLLTQ